MRPTSASFDDTQPVLLLRDVLDLVRAASLEQGREIGVVLEIKHATYFAGMRLGHRRPDRGGAAGGGLGATASCP